MKKKNAIYRSKEEWQQIIADWKASGKSKKTWCRENSIPPTSLYSALVRFEGQPKDSLKRSDFIEIRSKQIEGLTINYKGLSIHLSADFDEYVLTRFLKLVDQLSC